MLVGWRVVRHLIILNHQNMGIKVDIRDNEWLFDWLIDYIEMTLTNMMGNITIHEREVLFLQRNNTRFLTLLEWIYFPTNMGVDLCNWNERFWDRKLTMDIPANDNRPIKLIWKCETVLWIPTSPIYLKTPCYELPNMVWVFFCFFCFF